MFRRIGSALLAAASVSCTRSRVDVEIVSSSLAVPSTAVEVRNVRWLSFRVEAVLRNKGSTTVFLPACPEVIEVEDGTAWLPVWRPTCLLVQVPPRILRPGEELQVSLPVAAALGGAGAPNWSSPRIAGRYRLVLAIFRRKRGLQLSGPLPLAQRTSSPFDLQEPGREP